jgi:hypothetical protein
MLSKVSDLVLCVNVCVIPVAVFSSLLDVCDMHFIVLYQEVSRKKVVLYFAWDSFLIFSSVLLCNSLLFLQKSISSSIHIVSVKIKGL